MRKLTAGILAVVIVFGAFLPLHTAEASSKVSITGNSVLTAKQMGDYVLLKNPVPRLMEIDIYRLADLFLAIGRAEGIRGDIAFAQSLHETGYFKYGNDVVPEQNNYAGIGAVGGGARGAFFQTPEEGVRAQIQHLKAYANKEPLVTEKIDPRFDLVTRGIAPNWTDLNGRWAVPGTGYGEKILSIFNDMSSINLSIPNVDTTITYELPIASLYLKADRPLVAPNGTVHKTLPKNYSYRIFGTIGNNYNLGGGYTVAANSAKMNVYIGRLYIKNTNVTLYKPDGSFHRKLSVGENIRVYSFDNARYYVGGGYYVAKSQDVSFYKGTIKITGDTNLFNRSGETVRILKNGQQFRVYAINGNVLDLGAGLFITYDKRKQLYDNF